MKATGATRLKIARIQFWESWSISEGMRLGKMLMTLSLVSLLSISCFEDLDDNYREATTTEINEFIWRGLNYFYLYKGSVPQLQ
ncbi:MAG: hypothetical protein RIQ82_916, partial [Bacteroidota bacterium]